MESVRDSAPDTEQYTRQYESLLERLCEESKSPVNVEEENIEIRVADALSVVVVTSVLPTHPNADLIVSVLSTHLRLERELESCQVIIVADQPKVIAANAKERFKSGRVAPEHIDAYNQYLLRLEELCARRTFPFVNCRVVRAPEYSGFGGCLKLGLKLLKTPYVLVLQHDRILETPFDVSDVLRTMMRAPKRIRYVGLASNSSCGAEIRYRSMGYRVQDYSTQTVGSKKPLVAIPFWYDATHIANVQFYLDFVFGWHVVANSQYEKPFRLRRGEFPEDKLGNAMLTLFKQKGLQLHGAFGCYLLDDGQTIFARHVHGRKLGNGEARMLGNFVDPSAWEIPEPDKSSRDGVIDELEEKKT